MCKRHFMLIFTPSLSFRMGLDFFSSLLFAAEHCQCCWIQMRYGSAKNVQDTDNGLFASKHSIDDFGESLFYLWCLFVTLTVKYFFTAFCGPLSSLMSFKDLYGLTYRLYMYSFYCILAISKTLKKFSIYLKFRSGRSVKHIHNIQAF